MSDTFSEPTDELDVADDYTDPSGYEPADAWSGPTQEEWAQVTGTIGYLGSLMQQAQAAEQHAYAEQQRSAFDELLDPFSDGYDPERAVDAMLEQRVAPLAAAVQQYEYREALAEAWDTAYDLLDQFGIGEEHDQDSVLQQANSLIEDAQAEVGVSSLQELVEWLSSQTGESYEDASQRIGHFALSLAAERHNRAKATAGMDEVQLARMMTSSSAPITHVGPPRGGDEMSLVAKYMRGA